jgi:hypothetical protein
MVFETNFRESQMSSVLRRKRTGEIAGGRDTAGCFTPVGY